METATELTAVELEKLWDERNDREETGGWSMLYLPSCYDDPQTHAKAGTIHICYYCCFPEGRGHDSSCEWVSADVKKLGRGAGTRIEVPKGGLPASTSFF